MLVNRGIQIAIVAALLWQARTDAASAAVKFCGRQLGEIMSRVCHAYNSPSWDIPTVVEQHGTSTRRKRQLGIADECCTIGCTWEQLSKYCSISAYSESPLDELEAHMIADRSAENAGSAPALVGNAFGSAAGAGAGAGAGAEAAASEDLIRSAARAAPVVGTVSPLLTWGRTLNTDLPPLERDRYAYVAIYT
ncbi:uncharacterized protein LOC135073601 isoform X2 [Ostrinia nubilalis]|uniref:uncharacterized protein LOC135073601 isoform X2 n=1 Tax=Ostrinia nubilalis TaxID=29057 RepID=UPI00308254EB